MRIERLRGWLLASAVLLLAVVAGFIGTARYVRRHLLAKAVEKLGANVKVDSSGITWSHTNGVQTDYVVHAGREVEHSDGKVALHDVWIKLCGREQKRADMVRGDEWEWDQKSGVIRALGVAHIELRAAAGKPGCSATDDAATAEASGAKVMRATTSDLIYMQRLGLAATSAPIEFESGTMRGHAVGADYASDSAQLVLHSAVSMTGMSAGQPVEMNAASAEMDGQERLIRLTGARYSTGAGDAIRMATAEHALLHLRADQTLERIEAEGDVTLEADGGTVTSAKADAAMNAEGHPVSALLTGGVRYVVTAPLEERRGEANEAAIQFDGKAHPQAQHAVFTGLAHFVQKTRTDAAKAAWNTRELTASKVEVALAAGPDGKNEVREAEGVGGAKFSEVNVGTGTGAGASGAGPATTEIAADDLKAHFVARGDAKRPGTELETVEGVGHTLVRQLNAAGVEQTSAGDTLQARFQPGTAGGVKKTASGSNKDSAEDSADALASAVQSGHVVVTRREPAKSGSDEERATAQQAVYDGDSKHATLSGNVELTDAGSRLWSSQLVLDRMTGNAQAMGPVKVEYVQESGANAAHGKSDTDQEPVHVLAERAELDHAKDTVTFHGRPARMWRSGSQVQAPVIEVERTAKRLSARGESGTSVAAQVQTMLAGAAGSASSGKGSAGAGQSCPGDAAAGGSKAASPNGGLQAVRIASGGLEYSQDANEADFTGGFRAETSDADGATTVRASEGKVYLKSATAGAQSAAPSLEGSVDRMLASGQVLVDRPALHASGGRLVYTATDRRILLTGDGAALPKATDGRGNVTTGVALEFLRACNGGGGDTVEVLNQVPGGSAAAAGVHTEVRADAKQQRTAR